MYNELCHLCEQTREFYLKSEVGQRHLLLNTPLNLDIKTDYYINKVIIDRNNIVFVADMRIFLQLDKISEHEFIDIILEKMFTIKILLEDNLLDLNDSQFLGCMSKTKSSILSTSYTFKSQLYK